MDILGMDPKTLGLAFITGLIPSLFWLWFWLKEEENPEPKALLTIVFIMGMVAVVAVLPIQKFIQNIISDENARIILWAGAEEVMKFLAVLVILYKTKIAERPIDWPIYMITAAIGFTTLENALFLIKPFAVDQATVALLTGQLRFLGSTLLHTVTSGILGITLGVSVHMGSLKKVWHFFVGLIIAIALHSAFNFFIIRNDGKDFLQVFAFLWVTTVVVLLLFEKVRRMTEEDF